jgi:NAD(P)-dependent dehydrogenase (short-subunit alcohol dehydrogenase family)
MGNHSSSQLLTCYRNFAGIVGAAAKVSWDTEVKDFEKVMAVNSTGVFVCTKFELQQMIKQPPLDE